MPEPIDGWFAVRRVAPDVVRLTEPFVHRFVRANIWLYEGPDLDVLVDAGNGLVPLAPVVDGLRDRGKPLVAVATHAHVDHAGGLAEFATRLGHVAEARAFAHMDDADTLAGYLRASAYEPGAPPGLPPLSDVAMRPAPLTRVLADGDRIEMGGGRALTVQHLPGHSPGSIALVDEATGTLFGGDVIYDGAIVDDLPHSDVAVYRASLERLLAVPVARAYCGHGPVLRGDDVGRLIRAYLSGERR
jgi:glyoxylase-like metal-dependent hydrolase (beta-lactamase superfamily II)